MPVHCALGCEELGVHRFPNPIKFSEKFKAWVHIMGDNLEKPEDYMKYKNKRVCPIHFTEKDKNRNNRLNALAVPSLHLPAWCTLHQPVDGNVAPTATSINNSIINIGINDKGSNKIPANSPIGYTKGNDETDISIESLATKGKIVINKVPASVVATKAPETVSNGVSSLVIPEVAASKGKKYQEINKIPANSRIGYTKRNETVINIKPLATEGKIVINKVSASDVATKALETVSNGVSSLFIPEVAAIEEISTDDEINIPIRTGVVIEHNYCLESDERMNVSETMVPPLENSKRQDGTRRNGQKTTTTRQIKNLRSEISRLRKRCFYYKTRLETARKLSNSKALEQITKPMTQPGKLFTLMNFRESKKNLREEDSLLKKKCCHYLFLKKVPNVTHCCKNILHCLQKNL